MIPLRDSIPSRRTPVVCYAVVFLCTLAFLAQMMLDRPEQSVAELLGMVPVRVSHPDRTIVVKRPEPVRTTTGIRFRTVSHALPSAPIPEWATLLTCMFLHGGWMHFLGNMWFLYIFGDNVEDRFGHIGFTMLYLGTGVAAGLAHLLTDIDSPIPTIGASGAIAGVMGAYAFLYHHARVLAVLPLFVIFPTFVLPAPVFLGIWFLMQTVSGLGSITSGATGGVAWWAHIGGFVAGALIAVAVGRNDHSTE